MIEDLTSYSTTPLSSVALQFLVLVYNSDEPCSSKPVFIPPTIHQGTCIAIPPATTFNTTLVATSGGPGVSIREIQTVSPLGVEKGGLYRVEQSSSYYVNITWTPTVSQHNETHLFCYTALNSAGLSSEQTCIEFLPGQFPPRPIQETATTNGQLVHPSNTTWHIQFDIEIQRPTMVALVTFHEHETEREVYRIDTSLSPEVTFTQPNQISITPRYPFAEKTAYYINFGRGIVQGLLGCKPGNEPVKDKEFWTFETRDVTPPVVRFLASPSLSNSNMTFSWESNELVTWSCMLTEGVLTIELNCSGGFWRGYGLTEGTHLFQVEATDEAGNLAQLSHSFEVDLTPPITSILQNPALVSNQERAFLRFRCNEYCSLECKLVVGGTSEMDLDYFPCNSGRFTTFTLQHDSNYTFSVSGTDQVGNKGEAVMYTWETDFEYPTLFGVSNKSIPCTNSTSPDDTGRPQATDNREEAPSVVYSDLSTYCSIKRTWSATDAAGNTAYLVQHIALEFSPSVSLLPLLSFQCDSASRDPIQVPTNTASAPNPCRRPLQILYENSISHYICPGNFNRTWTVVDDCNQKNTSSLQTIHLYDLCPSHACGRNESTPRGVCTFGTCTCNSPWFGEDCSALIYKPQIEPVNDTILQEAVEYIEIMKLFQGTPPLTWSLLLGPDRLTMDQLSGQITWRRAQAGNYTVSVQVENQVGTATVMWSIQVKAGYNAFLDAVSPNSYPQARPVQLTGHVEYIPGNVIKNLLASIVPVSIDITGNQAIRTLKTITKSNGTFSTVFYPAPKEYGTYTARARHPKSSHFMEQTQWHFLGMRATPGVIHLIGAAADTFENTFYNATMVINDGPAAFTNLRAIPVLGSLVELVRVQLQFHRVTSTNVLRPGDGVLMDIIVQTTRALEAVFLVRLETTEGTTLQLSVNLRIAQLLPSFIISPPSVNTRIIRGRVNIFQFNVTNVGRVEATSVRAILPATDFISFISFGTQQQVEGVLTLGSRESALLSILVQTPSNQQLGEINGNIIVYSKETSRSIPLRFVVSSDVQLNLTVRVEDEYTYFAAGEPLVNNAVVRLVNIQRNIRVTKTTEADNGTVTFSDIPEDHYELVIEAPKHQTLSLTIITSINNPILTVFVQRQAVTYTWSVTPTTFEDTYTITIETDFETHVPQPVVTITPAEIELEELELGLVDTLQFNITNHGLIRADDLQFELPTDHPFLSFSTNISDVGSLEPLSSITVPVQVSRKTREKRYVIWIIYAINLVYSYICGDLQFRRCPVLLKKQEYRQDEMPVIVKQQDRQVEMPVIVKQQDRQEAPVITSVQWPRCLTGCGSGGGGVGVGIAGFSFNGLSARTPAFCNKCVQSWLDCVPTPKSLPLAGCIPKLLRGSLRLEWSHALGWIDCALGDLAKLFQPISAVASLVSDLNPIKLAANCFFSILRNCFHHSCESNRRRRSLTSMVNELTEAIYPIRLSIDIGIEILGDELWLTVADSKWLSNVLRPAIDDQSEMGVLISQMELSSILEAPPPNGTTIELVRSMVERLNNTQFGWNNGQLEPEEGSNMASYSTFRNLSESIDLYQKKAQDRGFSSYVEAYNFAANELNKLDSWESAGGVCAVVRIRVEQELAVTREAFVAKLEIENQEDSPLGGVKIEIIITDTATREEATGRFSIGNPAISGSFSSDDDDLSLPSAKLGSIEWLIVPYSEAAPTSNKIYDVSGVLSYDLNGEEIVIPLQPTKITIIPDSSLLVHYFWEKYVVGDDPFTDEREPSVPFTLGIAVKNGGYGTASNVRITSGQPEIIENERGLLVTFRIIGANIGRESVSPSLMVNFNDITPNTTKVARWYIVSSLQGEFKNYSATFENVNPLGDPKLSILDELKIHEVIRNVRIYSGDEEDGILDFLVNDLKDLGALPDALYSSKTLQRYNVTTGVVVSVQNVENGRSVEVHTSTNVSGWTYFRYEDTQDIFDSTALSVNITKHDHNRNVSLPSENCWITKDRQRPRNNMNISQPFYLHIVDYVERSDNITYMLDMCASDCSIEERPYEPIITEATPGPTPAVTPTRDVTATTVVMVTTPTPVVTPTHDVTPTTVVMVTMPTPMDNATAIPLATGTPTPTVTMTMVPPCKCINLTCCLLLIVLLVCLLKEQKGRLLTLGNR